MKEKTMFVGWPEDQMESVPGCPVGADRRRSVLYEVAWIERITIQCITVLRVCGICTSASSAGLPILSPGLPTAVFGVLTPGTIPIVTWPKG